MNYGGDIQLDLRISSKYTKNKAEIDNLGVKTINKAKKGDKNIQYFEYEKNGKIEIINTTEKNEIIPNIFINKGISFLYE